MENYYNDSYKKIVRGTAIFDALLMLPFAIPGVVGLFLSLLESVHGAFSFSGTIPEFDPVHLLFTNLLGVIVLFWSIVRYYDPGIFIVKADIVARFVFSFLMIFYFLVYHVTAIVLGLVATEILCAALQIYALKKAKVR